MSVQLQIDWVSQQHLMNQLDIMRATGKRSGYSAIVKLGMKIKTEAQLRLKGRRHVVTARLVNSIFLKGKEKVDNPNYSDNIGNSFSGDLVTVSVGEGELAVGTNVEYAGKIEAKDSYLAWAAANVNIEQSVAQDMRDAFKFGKG